MTSDMTADKATALRKPFPPESVGKLPKGGQMLDYVGHAAVTDRLLSVDPDWNWEPFAVGPDGLPVLDSGRNLWIKLTVCGVTRIGVGDGKSLKECIGDAIRNAAMRFGVALDLWAKENLVEFAQAVNGHQRAQQQEPPPPPDEPEPATAKPIQPKTRAQMFALFSERGVTDAEAQRAGIARVIGHEIQSRSDLTETEAQAVIKSLRGAA